MPAKRNNDEAGELFLGILFGIIGILILLITFRQGDFSFLLESTDAGDMDVPNILLAALGMVTLYLAIKKIIKANNRKNDT
jgi:hypothetical protein